MKRVIIVGAGASAAAAALQLAGMGIRPLMLDVGVLPGKPVRAAGNLYEWRERHDSFDLHIGPDFSGVSDVITGESGIAKLNAPNSRFVTERAAELSPLDAEQFQAMQSFALGGLGNAWGAGLYRFVDADLANFPIRAADLDPYADVLTAEIGISGAGDDLAPYFGSPQGLLPPLRLSRNAGQVYEAYRRRREQMRRAGIAMGRPRIGALSVGHDGRTPCDYSNTEFWQDQPYLYTPAVTLRKLIAEGQLDYRPGFLVESYEECGANGGGAERTAPVLVTARELATGQRVTFDGDVLLLAAGVIGTTKIVLSSSGDTRTVLPLLENPAVQVPFVIPSAIGRRLDTHTFGLTQLNLVWEPTPYGCLGQGSILEITSPMRAEFFGRFPLSARANLALVKAMLPAMLVMQLYFSVSVQGPASLSLKPDGALRIVGKPNAIDVGKLGGLLTALRRLGLWTHPMLIYKPETGHAIHYAGTLPMRHAPGSYQCWPDGRLAGTERIYVADSAGFSDLPAKNMSLGMMSNAMRVAAGAVAPAPIEARPASEASAAERPASRLAAAAGTGAKRVLVTGASGFIAGHFCRRMAAEGWEVFGVDRAGAPVPHGYMRVFPVGLGESMAGVLAETQPHAILHTALDPAPNRYDVNVGGTRRWLEEGQAAGVGVQVLLSSLSAAENALAEYGRGKWALEQAFNATGEVTVRLGVVVGQGGMFARLVESARRSPVIPLLGGGRQLLYVLGVERLAEILRDMARANGEGLRSRSWNLPQPEPYTLREVMDAIVRGYGFKRVTLSLPVRPALWGVELLEKQPLVRLPVSSTNVRGLMQAGRQTFPSDFPRFGYPEQSLDELVRLARR